MKISILICTTLFFVLVPCFAVLAEHPTPGSLCENVGATDAEDFWNKWEEADLVVYGQPTLANNTAIGIVIVSRSAPPVISEVFDVRTLQVWKGPTTFPPIEVSTTWSFSMYDCGQPPGYCVYMPENCALAVESGTPQVFFLKYARFQWETFTAYGTGIYDLQWLESEVGEPVSTEATTWGSIKAIYR